MKTSEWNFKSFDNLELCAREWSPDGPPKGVAILVHGLGEHVGRYAHVATAFTLSRYAFVGFDMRGHGKSQGRRGHTPSLEAYFKDLDQFISLVEEKFPGIPKILYGHSLGANLVSIYTPSRLPKITCAIATAPALVSATQSQKAKVFLGKILGSIWPTFTLSNGIDVTTLSKDPEVVRAYVEDPLVHDRVTASWGKHLMGLFGQAKALAPSFPVPILIMHGENDRLGLARGGQEWAALIPKEKSTFKLWAGLNHEIHNEPEKIQVINFMLDWLDKLIPG